MARYKKERKLKKMQSVDLRRRSRIVFEPVIQIDKPEDESSIRVPKKYNYDFIMAGVNPTKEERIRAIRKSILTYCHMIKR